MTTFVLAPTTAWSYSTGYATPRVMLEQGLLAAYRQRDNGTLRHIDLAPVGSSRRETAEWVYDQTADGRTVAAIARDLHSSVATVRRFLESLELTEEVEAGEWDGLHFGPDGTPEWGDNPEDPADDSDPAATPPGADTAPGSDCEPTGTTGDDLADALAASLAEETLARVDANA
jgi:hypothetical protein